MKTVRKLLCLALVLVMALSLAPTALGDGGHVHSWRERSRTEPTCTKEGSVTYFCSCGEIKTETLPALGHDWDSGRIWQDDSFPGGEKLRFTCRRCGYTWDEALPQEEPDEYGWEPPEEPEEPAIPDGAVSPATGEPEGEAKIKFEAKHIWHWNDEHKVGGAINIYGFLHNLGDISLFGAVLDMYRWDKSAGAFVFYDTVTGDNKGEGYSLWANHYNYARINHDYIIEEWDLENAEDGLAKLQLVARAETEEGQTVESEPLLYSFPIYDPSLLLEAEDCSEVQAPVDGYVKVEVTVASTGTETYAYDHLWSWRFDSEGHHEPGEDELRNYDLSHLQPGSPEKAEFWIQVTAEDAAEGEVRRKLCLRFLRWSRKDGRTVFPDTPMEDQGLELVWWGAWGCTNWVEIVIPLPENLDDAYPASAPLTSCVPALTGLGEGTAEWTLTRCYEHAALAREAEGKRPEEALALWAEALDAEYEEWLNEADESLRPLIEAERDAFNEQMEACRAAWADLVGEDYAAEKAAELAMHKLSLLCFSRRADAEAWAAVTAAPEALDAAGSPAACLRQSWDGATELQTRETLCENHRGMELRASDAESARALKLGWLLALNGETDEWYLSADEESRPLIAEARQSFGRWLKAEEALLSLQFPEDPALVQQLLVLAVRERAMDSCRAGG